MVPICLLLVQALGGTLRYSGGLLGVNADVTLFTMQARAAIRLQGIPIGGLVEGGASFDTNYKVTLDDELTRRLRHLRVHIVSMLPTPSWDHVYVKIRLPFLLGTHTIGLARDMSVPHTSVC